jgi:GTPase SAR1 family protein
MNISPVYLLNIWGFFINKTQLNMDKSELKDKIGNYFTMSYDEKDELLVEIIRIYVNVKEKIRNSNISIIDLIEDDIKTFEQTEEFEAAQALTDISEAYYRIIKEMRDDELLQVIKNLEDKNKNGN